MCCAVVVAISRTGRYEGQIGVMCETHYGIVCIRISLIVIIDPVFFLAARGRRIAARMYTQIETATATTDAEIIA
jgi:hypothetical protein